MNRPSESPGKLATVGQAPFKPVARPTEKDEEEMIEIHVNDETKGIQRDFKCPKKLLFREMKYFKNHAKESYSDDLDISVHCDVAIFEWLMRYIRDKSDP